jgi:ribonuclease HI
LDNQSEASARKPKERWKPPEDGWVKVNTDGSFDGCLGCGAGAAVLRDHHGKVLAAQARWLGPIHDALSAEALAAYDGLKIAALQDFARIVLESDSVVLVAALNSSSLDRSAVAGICHDIRELSRSFSDFKVYFVRREANALADRCVKEISCETRFLLWLDCFPLWIEEAAAADCNPAME